MSPEDQKILNKLEEALDLAIQTNQKGLKSGQTLYLDFDLKVPANVAEVIIQNYKQAGWSRVRVYEDKDEAEKTVIELAKGPWRSFFRQVFGFYRA